MYRRDPDLLLFVALLVLQVVPLWAFRCFPSQDGPTHLENAVILRDYARPDRPLLREFYTLSDRFHPNWFGHLALVGLMTVLPPLLAEKVLLTGYVILLPLGLRYALEGVRQGAGWLAVLGFPFVGNFLFHMGFYNFCWSLALFPFVAGYYIRHWQSFGVRQSLVLGLLALLLYFCHPVGLAAAGLTVGVLALAWIGLGRRLLGPVLAFVPAVALGAAFVGRQGGGAVWQTPRLVLWDRLWQMEMLVSYVNLERLFTEALFCGLVVLTGLVIASRWRTRAVERRDCLLAVAGAMFAAYFAAPTELSGGGFVEPRLALLAFLTLILWLGVHPFSRTLKHLVQAAATVIALGLLTLHVFAMRQLNEYLTDYLSAQPHVEPNRTLLPLVFARSLHTGSGWTDNVKVGVFRNAGGYLAACDGVIDLENYEAHSGYFPVDFRPQVDPFVQLNPEHFGQDVGLQAEPPDVDILGYTERTGLPVDYVLLWNVRPGQEQTPAGRRVFEQLATHYELIHTSPLGLLRLYRRAARR